MTLSRHAKTALIVMKLDGPLSEDAVNALLAQKPPIRMVRGVVLPELANG